MTFLIMIVLNLYFSAVNSVDSFRRSISFNSCSVLLGSLANEAKMVLIFIFVDFNFIYKIVSGKLFNLMTFRKNRTNMVEQLSLEPRLKRTGKKQTKQDKIRTNIKIYITFLNLQFYLYLKDLLMKMLGYLSIILVDHRHFLRK